MISTELLMALIPLVLLELGLKVFCFLDWRSREEFRTLGRIPWLLIFLFVNFLGPLAYLVWGRNAGKDRP